MTLKALMNASGEVSHNVGSPISGGSFTITSTPSSNVKADSQGVYSGPLNGTFSNGNATGFVSGSVSGSWVINPTAVAVKVDGKEVIREDDTGTLTASGTIDPPASPPTGPISGGVIVSDAGQGFVNGD